MPTTQDVLNAKQETVATCDAQLLASAALQNASTQAQSDSMEPGMAAIRAKRTAIAVQDYQAALDDPALQAALAKIQEATADMRRAALNMTTVTGFINNVAGFVNAGGTVLSALQGA